MEEIICATDAGREGELIFRLVYEQAGCTKAVKRLWISSMEETAIRKGFEDLKDGSCYENLYQSALCRAKADWLVGINASRLFSVLYNQNLKVGRVQTPTLAMIVDRNQKIREFKKDKFYIVHLKSGGLDGISNHYESKEAAERVAADCEGKECRVTKDVATEKSVNPPKLYDLTTLQREANRILGYTAQQTLDAAQSLYEKKLITYPRTDSQFLTDDMGDSVNRLLPVIFARMPFVQSLRYEPDVNQILDSRKVSDHHAIIPTMEIEGFELEKLKEMEKNILYLIAGKLLTAVGSRYLYESHKCELSCAGHFFYVTTNQIKQQGFKKMERQLYNFIKGKKEAEDAQELKIAGNSVFEQCHTSVSEQYTQPPKQFTEDTLLAAMERAGNEELTEETEKKGIGTPATRASIIEKLIQSGFVQREKKNLIPTEKGDALITVLPDEIKSPKMTAQWELSLNLIAQGKDSPEAFIDAISNMLMELVGRYHEITDEKPAPFQKKEKESLGKCPRCGSNVVEGNKNFYCINRDCQFALWKNDRFFESQGKKMDAKTVRKLLSKGKIHYKDWVSKKTGKTYAATAVLKDTGEGYVKFNLEFPKR